MPTDPKLKEEAGKKIAKANWLRAIARIEVLAVTEEAAKSSLEKHVQKIEKDERLIVYTKEFGDEIKKLTNPLPHIKEAYSQIVSLEFAAKGLESLVFFVMAYGPSSLEVIEPHKFSVDIGEAQSILTAISSMMHQFASTGAGGLLVST